MEELLITIFVVTLCGDVTFGLAISHTDVLARPGSELRSLSLQSDLVLLGISMIATAVTGFGAAMLNKTERLLTVMEGNAAARKFPTMPAIACPLASAAEPAASKSYVERDTGLADINHCVGNCAFP
jgi:hypothetical protein